MILFCLFISLWNLTLLGPNGENPCYDESVTVDVVQTAEGDVTTTKWHYLAGNTTQSVTVTVTKVADAEYMRFSCTVPEGWTVTDLDFPTVAIDRPENAKLIVPAGYGVEYDLPENGSVNSRYPSCTGSMQMVMLYDKSGTWYYSSQDLDACTKTYIVTGSKDNVVFTQRIPASYEWTSASGEFSLPWATVFVYNKDSWQNTALTYYRPFSFSTEWGSKLLKDRQTVSWIKDADIWIRPKNMFPEVVSALEKSVDYYGSGTCIHWYHWHRIPYDTNYPEYFPARDGFIQKVQELQAKGAHVTPYTNGRLWDPATESYRQRGHLASCRKKDGTLYSEIYPTSKVINTVSCPASDVWQQTLNDFARRALDELGVDGLYIDQIGAAASEPCYATNHNHAPGGGGWWPKAYRQIINSLRAEAFGSTRAITTEENAECYIDLFDMLLIVNTPHGNGASMVPLFPLVYSDRAIYSGLNYYHEKLCDGHFLFNNARSLLWGAQLGWIQPEWLMKDENRVEIEFLKTLGDFRSRNHDLFVGGRFVGDVALAGDIATVTVLNNETYPVVMASKWLSITGKEAVILVNYSAGDTVVSLPDGRQVVVPAYNAVRL